MAEIVTLAVDPTYRLHNHELSMCSPGLLTNDVVLECLFDDIRCMDHETKLTLLGKHHLLMRRG